MKLEYVPTGENKADNYTREDMGNDVRLDPQCYVYLWDNFGPFQIDLMMASPANVMKNLGDHNFPDLKFFQDIGLKDVWVQIFLVRIYITWGSSTVLLQLGW